MSSIAIIGAGVAGLTAARTLVARGHEVVVFERSRAPGGRVATRRLLDVELPRRGTVDLAFDHGAQYFTVRDPRFAAVVTQWERDRIVAPWTGRIVAFDGEGWEDVAEGTDRYVGKPGMSAIGRALSDGLAVRYETRVGALKRAAGGWRVMAPGDTGLGTFDQVIVAVPAPHAVALLTDAPELAAIAAAVVMKPCWTALAAFEEPVPTRFDAAFVAGSPLGWVARNQSKPKRGLTECWVLHATHEWSLAQLDRQPDIVGPFLMEAFEELVRGKVPRPFSLTTHRWRHALADPPLFTRDERRDAGEVCDNASAADRRGGAGGGGSDIERTGGALRDRALGIAVCGDWCAGSRIEGAYLSGFAAAGL